MEWIRGEALGYGSFATVSIAKPKKHSLDIPLVMAVKSCGASHSASLINEKSVLDDLGDCPQTIRCFGANFSSEDGENLYNLLLEYASGGSLADKLSSSGDRRLPEFDVRRYTKDILTGLQYVHEYGYVHCDIKLQNILLCSSTTGHEVAKISDFGLAKKAGERREKVRVELRGTPMYMSPEMVVSGEQEAPADVWALGCLVAELMAGVPAWRFPADADVCRLLMRIGVGDEVPEIPGKLSAEGKDFLGKCFIKDPTKRWTAEMLLNHPFVVDQEDDDRETVALEHTCYEACSTSPRCPFDFPDWDQSSCEITPLPSPLIDTWSAIEFSSSSSSSPADRLRPLVTDQVLDWSVLDSWVTVR